jgi:hypothetical protein
VARPSPISAVSAVFDRGGAGRAVGAELGDLGGFELLHRGLVADHDLGKQAGQLGGGVLADAFGTDEVAEFVVFRLGRIELEFDALSATGNPSAVRASRPRPFAAAPAGGIRWRRRAPRSR